MAKLTLVEKMLQAYTRGEPMPLKGHARIVLTDARDGTVKKVVESDNMVTNAVASILANNWNLKMNASAIQPLRKMFGGVLLFGENITESADNYNYPNQTLNPLYAHAGNEANDTVSTKRGSPVPADFVYGISCASAACEPMGDCLVGG